MNYQQAPHCSNKYVSCPGIPPWVISAKGVDVVDGHASQAPWGTQCQGADCIPLIEKEPGDRPYSDGRLGRYAEKGIWVCADFAEDCFHHREDTGIRSVYERKRVEVYGKPDVWFSCHRAVQQPYGGISFATCVSLTRYRSIRENDECEKQT